VRDNNGFYNITLVNKRYQDAHPDMYAKIPSDWMKLASTRKLINEIKSMYGLTDLVIKHNNIPNYLRGTYLHPILYTEYMAWMDIKYKVKIMGRFCNINATPDEDILIMRDDNGFYNIAMASRRYNNLYPNTVMKRVNCWTRCVYTQLLINEIQSMYGLKDIIVRHVDVSHSPKCCTYVHPILYTEFMAWVDVKYKAKLIGQFCNINISQEEVIKYDLVFNGL
jgi:hypothetical protein